LSWEINIAFREAGDTIAQVVEAIAESGLEPRERAIARQVALDALAERCVLTAGELVAELEHLGADGRRQVLDNAREALGLERSQAIDDREHLEGIRRTARLRSSGRDSQGMALQTCAVEDCSAMPLDEATGLPKAVCDRHWWCPEHRDLAGPDDHLPPDDVARVGPWFEEIPAPSVQLALEAHDERRRQEEEQRGQERAAERQAIRVARQRCVEEHYDDVFSGAGWAGRT
jgi:hypothetical protein